MSWTVRKWAFGSHKRIGPSFLPSCIAYYLVEGQLEVHKSNHTDVVH